MKSCAFFVSLILTFAGCPAWAEGEYAPVPESRREIDLRIEALDARRAEISTTGPKVATFVGLGVGAVGAITFGFGLERGSCDQGCAGGYDPTAMRAGLVLMGVGVVTTLIGGPIWAARTHRRNKIDADRKVLIEERKGLEAALSRIELGGESRNGMRFVTLGARF